MGRKFTVYGLRFSKTSFWNRMNTGFLDLAVATVLTACGIETIIRAMYYLVLIQLQQCLPLAVLKHALQNKNYDAFISVATVLTACGIETIERFASPEVSSTLQQCLPLAVLKLYRIIMKVQVS